jgi:hypothetical protein
MNVLIVYAHEERPRTWRTPPISYPSLDRYDESLQLKPEPS